MLKISEEKINRIKSLRQKGHSIPEIHRATGQSKSTVLRYIQGVTIQKKYHKRWLDRRNASKIISQRAWTHANKASQKRVSVLSKKDLAIIAASLYWGEGSKGDLSISNTDPNLIRVFLYCLRNEFNVEDKDLVISIRVYEDLNKKACLRFWSEIIGIKLDHSTSINIVKGAKHGKLKYGMCRLRVKKGGMLLKQLTSLRMCIINLSEPP